MNNQDWKTVKEYEDITYKKCTWTSQESRLTDPDVRNAFRPL